MQVGAVFGFTNDPSAEGLAVGQQIRALWSEEPKGDRRPVIVELSYWQYLAVHVGANDLSAILYDRELDFARRQSPSLLTADVEAFRDCLSQYHVGYVVVKSPELRQVLEQDVGIPAGDEINGYAFYRVPESLLVGETGRALSCPLTFGSGY
jgi:hypothetical protein